MHARKWLPWRSNCFSYGFHRSSTLHLDCLPIRYISSHGILFNRLPHQPMHLPRRRPANTNHLYQFHSIHNIITIMEMRDGGKWASETTGVRPQKLLSEKCHWVWAFFRDIILAWHSWDWRIIPLCNVGVAVVVNGHIDDDNNDSLAPILHQCGPLYGWISNHERYGHDYSFVVSFVLWHCVLVACHQPVLQFNRQYNLRANEQYMRLSVYIYLYMRVCTMWYQYIGCSWTSSGLRRWTTSFCTVEIPSGFHLETVENQWRAAIFNCLTKWNRIDILVCQYQVILFQRSCVSFACLLLTVKPQGRGTGVFLWSILRT